MKIRIKGNSLRIRVTKSEVDFFCKNGFLEDRTVFPTATFEYRLERVRNDGNLNADFEGNTIIMFVPEHLVNGWEVNDTVGFSHTMPGGDGKPFFLLLEKDFKCIDNSMQEDQSDNFDNPLHTCA